MRAALTLGAMIATSSLVAQAGAPLVTDDAAVVEAKSCQLEAWVEAARGARSYWLVPACNFTGNLELSVGAASLHSDGGPSSHQVQFQAKTVFGQSADGFWSVGAVGGAARDTGPIQNGASSSAYYAKALLSLYASEAFEVDLNVGASNAFGAGATVVAGAAVQYTLLSRATLLAEIFRDERGPGKYQLGGRYALVPSHLEAYVSYGNRLGNAVGGGWWVTAGIRINTSPFLP
jgi:hypothetical protein